MTRLIIALAAVLTLAVVAQPAHAIFPHRGRVVQRQVIVQKQVVQRQRVVVQQVVAQPYVQQVVVAQPVVAAYSQSVCYPQAQIVAPVYSQQVVSGCASFFAK